MYLEKWMLLLIILTKDLNSACRTSETAFGWIGSSPVFNYTLDINMDGTFSILSPTNLYPLQAGQQGPYQYLFGPNVLKCITLYIY
ncbi:hypothetical protein DPMN_150864, partial [Dreissena polymorpha]